MALKNVMGKGKDHSLPRSYYFTSKFQPKDTKKCKNGLPKRPNQKMQNSPFISSNKQRKMPNCQRQILQKFPSQFPMYKRKRKENTKWQIFYKKFYLKFLGKKQ
jgi:hypothetical protein